MPYLPIRADWSRFAPSQEVLSLNYDPPNVGQLVSVRLEVRDFEGTLVFRSDALDCSSGPALVSWTGELNQGNDPNTDPFATPLRSPYEIKIDATIGPEERGLVQPPEIPNREIGVSGQCHDSPVEPVSSEVASRVIVPQAPTSVSVSVLYDSVEIVRGPWLATNENFVRASAGSICNKLNLLGYYAGPPARAAVNADLLDKAKERFRRNHGDLVRNANPTANEFEDALDHAAGTARPTLTDDRNTEIGVNTAVPTGGGAPLRVYLEAAGFDDDLPHATDEFMQQIPANRNAANINWGALANKTRSEARKLNRPMIPLEAIIYLKDHSDGRVAAPRAVGPVRVDWSAIEPGEDVSHLPVDDRLYDGTRTYVHRLFKSNLVDRENDGNSNCPALYGGIRTPANNYRNPFWREAQPYAPYAVPTDDDTAKAVWVPAYRDWAAQQARVGRAGIYLWPSLIAGDRYRVRASLSFAGRTNRQALERANPGPARTYETKPIVVWRRVEIFAVVGWPTRNYGNLPQKCKARYAEAFHEMDFSQTRFETIANVINDGDYSNWYNHIRNGFPSVREADGILDATHVHNECPVVFLGARPRPKPTDNQKAGLSVFLMNMFNELVNRPNVPSPAGFILALLAERLRTGHLHPCGGVIFLEYKLSDDVRELFRDPMEDLPSTSNGNGELMGIIDQAVDANPDYVFTHEVGHCFWLTHHENARGEVKQHHDLYDHNCMMSYPHWGRRAPTYAHQVPRLYDPTFCGKCNLKLRGWDITHADILALDPPKPPDSLIALFYYDRADPGLQWNREIATVRGAFTAVSRGLFRERYFDRNPNFGTWSGELGDCDVYHHVTHGNVRCSRHSVRVASMSVAIPRYPTWCRGDDKKVKKFELEEQNICVDHNFDKNRLAGWVKDSLINPDTWYHNLTSVIQWTIDDHDSSRDVEFTYEDIENAFKRGTNAPRRLAFFSSCLLGWEKRFAKLFIDHGTPYVVAFRSRYETAQALDFSALFYEVLRLAEFDTNAIRGAFMHAVASCPHAEPCLFSAGGIIRGYARTMARGSGEYKELSWTDDAFHEPLFPRR
jgi:hypothetical protein